MKKVGILLSPGFEEIEALAVVDILRRGDVKCEMISTHGEFVEGAHKITVKSDIDLSKIEDLDLVILPGGMPGSTNLRDNENVINLIKKMDMEKKLIAAICAAPIVLEKAGIIRDRIITSYPNALEKQEEVRYSEERVVISENLITSRGPGTAMEFAYAILRVLDLEDKARSLENGMLLKK